MPLQAAMKLGPLLALVAATVLVAAVGSAGDPAARRRPLIQPFPLADVQVRSILDHAPVLMAVMLTSEN